MYRTVNDFLNVWEYESEATAKVFETLTKESLDQKVWDEGRTLKKLVWHIIASSVKMIEDGGIVTGDYKLYSENDDNLSVIVEEYKRSASFIKDSVSSNLKDSDMLVKVNVYGEVWEKGKLLHSLVLHQAHHRAQITVLMRQAGLKVPGVYGPSKEEWQQMGMTPQE